MYLNVRFRGLFWKSFFVFFNLFTDSLGATGVRCELYSEGLDIPSFVDF